MEWKEIQIFISSTFNDMHAERDYLIKYVFPELAEWCEKRRIRLVDVDLRWGVTKEESENNDALRKCLENIDDTHRFFLCLIGQRRGWVPNEDCEELARRKNELIKKGINPNDTSPPGYSEISKATTDEYPDLIGRERNPALLQKDETKANHYKSVTEIEIEHALLNPMYRFVNGEIKNPEDEPRVIFFERIDTFTDTLPDLYKKIYTNAAAPDPKWATEKTDELKAEIRVKISPREIIRYSCDWVWMTNADSPELAEEKNKDVKIGDEFGKGHLSNFRVCDSEFKDVVIEELQKLILNKYPNRKEEFVSNSDRYAKDREQQELFIQIASDGYIRRSDIEERLNNYISGKCNKPLLLTAEAGFGKTTLLAQYVKPRQGVKPGDTNSLFDSSKGIYRFCGASDLTSDPYMLWDSICHQVGVETPNSYEKLKQNIVPLLSAIAAKGCRHIVIDAVNQMTDGENMLHWFPDMLPSGIKIILSIKLTVQNRNSITLLTIKFEWFSIGRLADPDVKKSLIEQFLKQYLKALDKKQIEDICGIIRTNGKQTSIPNHSSDNPLYLKVLLHELHYFGYFTQLPDEIREYGSNPKEAFTRMLKRLENEDNAYVPISPSDSVPFLFGLLSLARNGLSEAEILDCFKQKFLNKLADQILGTIRFYFRQTRPFIARKDGRADFLYEEFKIAAIEKYPVNLHLVLAKSLFCTRPAECAYHARQAPDHEYLKRIYTNLDFLNRYYTKDGAVNLFNEMQRLEASVIPGEIQKFINETVSLLAKNPNAAPETFYKELPSTYKAEAGALCKNPWIKMDWVTLPIELAGTRTVGSDAIQSLEIRSGHIAEGSGEAFFLVSAKEVQVVNTRDLQTVSSFTVAADEEIESIFVSPKGELLVAVMRHGFSVFHLRRDTNGVVISSELKLNRKCRRIRFGSACVYVVGNKLIYQTSENDLFTITLESTLDEIPFPETGDVNIRENCPDCTICGYYLVADNHYYVFKKSSSQYFIHARIDGVLIHYELTANVNDMLAFKSRIVILTDGKTLVFTEALLHSASILECDFVPRSGVLFGDSLLLTSEHGQMYVLGTDGVIKDYGMLSVGRWDMKNRVYSIGDKKAFFFSDHRYALIGETLKTNFTIIKTKISHGAGEILFVDEDNCLRFRTQKTDRIISQSILQHLPYGFTSLMNYRCDWSGRGDVLHQGDGITAAMMTASGKRILVDPPEISSTIFDILFSNKIGSFIILYHNGKIRMIDGMGRRRDAETFRSSSRNYLLCDCGEFFGIITKRRLVQQANLFEETALAIHDKNGRMVFEDHYSGLKERPIHSIVYDSAENKVYVITSQEAVCYDISRNFSSKRLPFETPFIADTCGLSASNDLLYYQRQEQGLCVVDLNSGRLITCLPTHRSISNISPCSSETTVVENNEIVYETKLNRVNNK